MIPAGARSLLAALLGAATAAGFGPSAAAAQSGASVAVTGVVIDSGTRSPVEAASLLVEGPTTVRTESRRDGRWLLAGLPPGRYRLTVSALGYVERTLELEAPLREPLVVTLDTRALALDAIVVTASRRQQRLADAPVAIEVLRRDDLRRTGASDLASVLTERTGVQLQGGHPAGAGVMLQGMDSERVLVLVDGQPWVGRISGTADLSRIPASVVERVEVVKGPQATLYGSEAMGGVVNVITRRPRGGWGASATVTSGSQSRLDLAARLTGQRDALGFTLDAGRRTEDLVPGQGGEAGAGVRRHDGHARVVWERSDALRLEGSALVVDERQLWRSGQLRHFADNLQGALTLQGAWTAGDDRLALTLHGSHFDHLLRRGTRDTPPAESTGDRQTQSLAELDLMWNRSLASRVDLDVGVEVGREWIDAETVEGGVGSRTTTEPYAQATLSLGAWSVVPGLRFSHSSQWGGHWTPRLAVMTRPTPELALRASISSGYRVPSFKELSLDFLNSGPGFGYVVRGSPDLEPEESLNVSGSVEWAGSRAYVRLGAFHNAFDRFIETRALADSGGLTIYTYGNIANGHTAGMELEAGWSWAGLDGEAGWAWLTTEDASTGEPLLGRPEHSARASLSAPLAGFRANAAVTWTGRTPVARDPESEVVLERDPFLRLDARLARRVDRFDLALGVDNVLDRAPSEWPGFAGRRLHLTLTTTLFGITDP